MSAETRPESIGPDGDTLRQKCLDHREALIDEALKESFPASDPPSIARPACLDEAEQAR